jgi:hypothetical protein
MGACLGEALSADLLAPKRLETLRGLKVVVERRGAPSGAVVGVLRRPRRPRCRFSEFARSFIAREAATWAPLRAAGVRSLSTAVRTSVALGGEVRADETLLGRFRDRLRRAVTGQRGHTRAPQRPLGISRGSVSGMQCVAAPEITLTHALEVGGRLYARHR